MTISKYLVNFLKLYNNIEIKTNRIEEGSDEYGLFKSPSRDMITYSDNTQHITEYYQLLAKQSDTSDYDRRDSDEWLENLTYWVDDYDLENDYPAIDGNRTVRDIKLTGCPYPMSNTDHVILYQLSLSITYDREREDI